MHPGPFCWLDYEKRGLELLTSLFGLQNMFRKTPFLVIFHLGIFDNLTRRFSWVIPKIAFANLCKPMQDVLIIPVSSHLLKMETGRARKKLQNTEYLENEKSFSDGIKSISYNFHTLAFGKIWKNRGPLSMLQA